jgi:hypothetical protein
MRPWLRLVHEVAQYGWNEDYHWCDWVLARIQLREAEDLIEAR